MGTAYYNLQTAVVRQINNQELPQSDGPRAIPLLLDFTAMDTYRVDLSSLEQRDFFSMVQTVFVDLKDTDQPLTLSIEGTAQKIQIKGRTQGYYPVLAPNPTVLTISCAGGPPSLVVILINVPIMGVQWVTQ